VEDDPPIGEGRKEGCQHWADGIHRLIIRRPNKTSATADGNVDVTIGAEIDARTNWDAVRGPAPRDVEERISHLQLDSFGIILEVKN